jgi:hexosaminidase
MSLQARPGVFALKAGAAIAVPPDDAGGRAAAERLADLMARTRGFKLVVKVGAPNGPPSAPISFVRDPRTLGGPEAYDLQIGPNGAVVSAATDTGLFYGAETLWQLLTPSTARASVLVVGEVKIHDAPRFTWRGLMIDSARHYQSPQALKAILDVMAAHKLNVLHWHLTDDQGWRLEIKAFPRLTEIGAEPVSAASEIASPAPEPVEHGRRRRAHGRRPHARHAAVHRAPEPARQFYSQAEAREIVAYAAARHITLVPELDMPGHATAALAAYPQWASATPPPGASPDWGVLTNLYSPEQSTITAIDRILTEVMAIFPGPYIHVGGDEAVKLQWRSSAKVQTRMHDLGIGDEAGLQSWFIGQMGSFLAAHGRKLVGWDEILDGGLAPGATVMSWRGLGGAVAAAKAGHDAVLSPDPVLYFDHRQGDGPGEPPGRGPVVGLRQVYDFDPSPASLTPEQQAHILGLQGNLWTEHVRTDARAESMAFPREAAVAEIGWTPASRREFDDFARREAVELDRDHALGFDSSDSAYAPKVQADGQGGGMVALRLSNQADFGQIRYTLDGAPPTLESPAYDGPIQAALPVRVRAQVFDGARPVAPPLDRRLDPDSLDTRASQELRLCTEKAALNLEDPLPLKGPRPIFYVDIMNPCWIWRGADLTGVRAISASVTRIPYNFQFGGDPSRPKLRPPATPDGELEVRLDGCTGDPAAVLPLKPAAGRTEVVALPGAALAAHSGRHDLCFTFTGRSIAPLWVIDRVKLVRQAGPPLAGRHDRPAHRRARSRRRR